MKNEKSFAERVVAFLKLDDNSKVVKFQKQAVKVWQEQVELRKKEVSVLEEKKAELMEEKSEEIILDVDLTKLSTIESREAYLALYQGKLLALKRQIEAFDDLIEVKNAEIAEFEWLISTLS